MINNRLPDQSGGLIAVDRDGKIVMQHNTPSMSCGSASSDGLFEVRLDAFPAGISGQTSIIGHPQEDFGVTDFNRWIHLF